MSGNPCATVCKLALPARSPCARPASSELSRIDISGMRFVLPVRIACLRMRRDKVPMPLQINPSPCSPRLRQRELPRPGALSHICGSSAMVSMHARPLPVQRMCARPRQLVLVLVLAFVCLRGTGSVQHLRLRLLSRRSRRCAPCAADVYLEVLVCIERA